MEGNIHRVGRSLRRTSPQYVQSYVPRFSAVPYSRISAHCGEPAFVQRERDTETSVYIEKSEARLIQAILVPVQFGSAARVCLTPGEETHAQLQRPFGRQGTRPDRPLCCAKQSLSFSCCKSGSNNLRTTTVPYPSRLAARSHQLVLMRFASPCRYGTGHTYIHTWHCTVQTYLGSASIPGTKRTESLN